MTKKLLECIGIDPDRIRLEWISASEAPKFAQVIKDFVEEAKGIGPNPLYDRGEGPWIKSNFRVTDLA
jgi:F420-non-reducing hydrogenase iron-sulfur subunit